MFLKGVIHVKGVLKGEVTGGVIKGMCMCSYWGCKNSVFYNKYIIIYFIMANTTNTDLFISYNYMYSINSNTPHCL